MPLDNRVQDRRAIEALRAGVPNRDAVKALGSAQSHIEEQFRQQIASVSTDLADGKQTPGLLVAGDFGSGKSHLLEYLQHVALAANFVCSKVVISKETPLYDPGKLYRSALQAAIVPDKKGAALTEIASGLSFDSPGFEQLQAWVAKNAARLSSFFAATLFVYQHVADEEIRDRIVSFWTGDPLKTSELRSWLRDYGEASTHKLERTNLRDLPLQRFAFAPRLMVAAGYAGWVLLIDEVELIGRYSLRQRARSYAELARWAGKLSSFTYPGLTAVSAITRDFETAVLQDRGDEEKIPGRLRASGLEADALLASQAERGMRLIQQGQVVLQSPNPGSIASTRDRIREIHGRAYDWQPPPLALDHGPHSTRMREHVKRWINEWDLIRLYPGYQPNTVVEPIEPDNYTESPELETPDDVQGSGA